LQEIDSHFKLQKQMIVELFNTQSSGFKNQCYLVANGFNAILIDPAWDYDLIETYILNNKLTICAVLLTHSHFDHTNLADKFAKKYDIPVFMSESEIAYYGFKCTNLTQIGSQEKLEIKGININPILTPGHTIGSICYLIDDHFFTGDTLFIEGVGICMGNGSDPNKMFDSIQFIKGYLKPNTLIWPGHSFGQLPGKQFLFLQKNNIYIHFTNREHFVKFRMRKSQPDPFNFI